MTEFKVNTPQHALSVACYLHSKCSRVRKVSDLPDSSTPLIIQYLEAGLRFPNRADAARHTSMQPCSIVYLTTYLTLFP